MRSDDPQPPLKGRLTLMADMEICSRCGATTIGETCHRCGAPLQLAEQLKSYETQEPEAPTVELISRGHDVVEIDAVEIEGEVIDEVPPPPVPPGGVEVTVDDVTVITTDEDQQEYGEQLEVQPEEIDANITKPLPPARGAVGSDRWDHLRPHGEMPRLARRISITARVVETIAILTAVSGLGAAAIHFYLNTRLEAAGRGTLVVTNLDDLERIADISLLAVGGLSAITIMGLLLWRATGHSHGRPGRTGFLAWIALVAGIAVVVVFYLLRRDTVTEAIAANALIILGLGLVVSAFVVLARLVDRLDQAGISEPH